MAKKPAVRRSRKTKKEQEGTEREAVEQAAGDKAAGELSQLNADRPSPGHSPMSLASIFILDAWRHHHEDHADRHSPWIFL